MIEAKASPMAPIAQGKKAIISSLTVLNIETARKAFSAVRVSPVRPNTANVQRRINLEDEK